MAELRLRVSGLTCAACASGLTQTMLKHSGIKAATTNYADSMLFVEYDPGIIAGLAEIEALVRKAGLGVPMERVTLQYSSIEYAKAVACTETLKKIFGVKAVSIDCTQRLLTVEIWPIGLSTRELTDALIMDGVSCEVLSVEGGEEEQEQLRQIRLLRRLCIAVFLTMPLMWNPSPWLQFLLASLVQFGPGSYFYRGARQSICSHSLNMDFLVASSTTIIYLYSSYLAWTVNADIQLYFLSQCVLLCLILFGKYLELVAKGATARSIRGLLRLQPEDAVVERNGKEMTVPVSAITEYDVVLIRSGDRIPVDGHILEGECLMDESMLTGESTPIHKKTGDSVVAGTLNRSGSIRLIATSIGKDTVLQQIIRTVRKAQASKAPIQDFADKIASRFIPAVLLIACVVFFVWYFLLTAHDAEKSVLVTCGVLVVACPCALGLATPTSMMVGMGRAAELGILFRGAPDLERAGRVDTVVFDKTGTLTYGTPYVQQAVFVDPIDRASIFPLIAAVERHSSHPAAVAITAFCSIGDSISLPMPLDDFEEQIGGGVTGQVQESAISCGSRVYIKERGIDMSPLSAIDSRCENGDTEIVIALNGRAVGKFLLSDQLRDSAENTVQELQKRGIEVWLLSGDQEKIAQSVGKQLNISHILWGIRPDEKADCIRNLQAKGKTVAMVGDGVNDAPALACADVSIAMGSGTDVAMDAAGIMLVGGRLEALPRAISLSAQVMRNVRQNLLWALLYNGICIPLAACGVMNPSIAAAAMSASSIAVLLHALRLQKWAPAKSKERKVAGGFAGRETDPAPPGDDMPSV